MIIYLSTGKVKLRLNFLQFLRKSSRVSTYSAINFRQMFALNKIQFSIHWKLSFIHYVQSGYGDYWCHIQNTLWPITAHNNNIWLQNCFQNNFYLNFLLFSFMWIKFEGWKLLSVSQNSRVLDTKNFLSMITDNLEQFFHSRHHQLPLSNISTLKFAFSTEIFKRHWLTHKILSLSFCKHSHCVLPYTVWIIICENFISKQHSNLISVCFFGVSFTVK